MVAISAGAVGLRTHRVRRMTCQRVPVQWARGTVPALTRVPRPGEGLTLGGAGGCRLGAALTPSNEWYRPRYVSYLAGWWILRWEGGCPGSRRPADRQQAVGRP